MTRPPLRPDAAPPLPGSPDHTVLGSTPRSRPSLQLSLDASGVNLPIADREERRAYNREWRRQRRAAAMRGAVCAHCGSSDELELDHIDPRTKIAHAIWTWSESRRREELAKCQWLCRPCHVRKTFKDLEATIGPRLHGTLRMYDSGCHCAACRAANTERVRRQRRQHVC